MVFRERLEPKHANQAERGKGGNDFITASSCCDDPALVETEYYKSPWPLFALQTIYAQSIQVRSQAICDFARYAQRLFEGGGVKKRDPENIDDGGIVRKRISNWRLYNENEEKEIVKHLPISLGNHALAKLEREWITLRDSRSFDKEGLVESFNADTERLREEMQKQEHGMKKDTETVAIRYQAGAEGGKGLRDALEKTGTKNQKCGEENEMSNIQELERGVGDDVRKGEEDSAPSIAKSSADKTSTGAKEDAEPFVFNLRIF
ncbi:hypothetical protein ARMSODRAFT_1003188 [Armillaria solidipes]|uniref:Uncharacterized protein n=1 Tax=Armillaria solidipes TaxID=1076256 RepID=A0A2H3C3R7_9AGAR|nr:hypothetical protein ARMSODRAFT_1003188 [Armillaria solidipes]